MKNIKNQIFIYGAIMAFGGMSCGAALEIQPLKRGINLSHWFSQTRLPDHPPKPVTAQDMKLIRSLDFDHIRLPVDPERLWDFPDSGSMKLEVLQEVDAAIQLALDHDLNVVVDMHPRPDFKEQLKTEPEYIKALAIFWEALARHLSQYDRHHVALEILNEPMIEDLVQWQGMVDLLHATIRRAAPRHTIVIGGGEWSGIAPLRKLKPVDDSNVIYTFHFYDPHLFTHQGAIWGQEEWPYLKNIPYPLTREEGLEILDRVSNNVARTSLKSHMAEEWDAGEIDRHLEKAAAWAAEHQVTIWCGEFGVYQTYSDPTDRARYLADVRTAFENHGIGWAMWDYQGSFSLVEKETPKNRAQVDLPIAEALGLSPIVEN